MENDIHDNNIKLGPRRNKDHEGSFNEFIIAAVAALFIIKVPKNISAI